MLLGWDTAAKYFNMNNIKHYRHTSLSSEKKFCFIFKLFCVHKSFSPSDLQTPMEVSLSENLKVFRLSPLQCIGGLIVSPGYAGYLQDMLSLRNFTDFMCVLSALEFDI